MKKYSLQMVHTGRFARLLERTVIMDVSNSNQGASMV